MRPIKMIQARIVEVVPAPSYEPPLPLNLPQLDTPAKKIEPLKSPSKPHLLNDVKIWLAILLMAAGVLYGYVSNIQHQLRVLQWKQHVQNQYWMNGRWEGTGVTLTFSVAESKVGLRESHFAGRREVQQLKDIEWEGNMCLFTITDDASVKEMGTTPWQYVLLQDESDERIAKLYRLNFKHRYSFSRRPDVYSRIAPVPVVPSEEHTLVGNLTKHAEK